MEIFSKAQGSNPEKIIGSGRMAAKNNRII